MHGRKHTRYCHSSHAYRAAELLAYLAQPVTVLAPARHGPWRLEHGLSLQAFLSDASRMLQQSVQRQAASAESAAERWGHHGCWHASLCIH